MTLLLTRVLLWCDAACLWYERITHKLFVEVKQHQWLHALLCLTVYCTAVTEDNTRSFISMDTVGDFTLVSHTLLGLNAKMLNVCGAQADTLTFQKFIKPCYVKLR